MDTKNPQKPAKDLLFQVFVRTHSQSLKVIEDIGCQAYSKVAPATPTHGGGGGASSSGCRGSSGKHLGLICQYLVLYL